MTDTLTKQDLDEATKDGCVDDVECECDGCLEITSVCHPIEGVSVHYQSSCGFLTLKRRGCGKRIVQVAVAAAEVH